MKLNGDHLNKVRATDKVLVKELVKNRIGQEHIIPTLWHGKKLRPIQERNWPIPFVIKANHGSSMNYFVRSKSDLDWAKIERITDEWLKRDWPAYLCEDWYNKIDRQLLVEPLMVTTESDLRDYKIFVFGGNALLVQVDSDRFNKHTRAIFDRDWKRIQMELGYPKTNDVVQKPRHLAKMLDLSESLSLGFDFVRIDFYDLEDGPRFGEMTFAPDAGLGRFSPSRFDYVFGEIWDNALSKGKSKTEQRIDAKSRLHGAAGPDRHRHLDPARRGLSHHQYEEGE